MEEKDEVATLKETLQHQSLIMHKLQAELEEEREASATAAIEALSMILRLQEEKATEKMEACQYKRMAEERMHHAEESLVILEELLYQKEMEVASLKFNVQDYVDKLPLSGDVSEDNTSKVNISANQFMKGPRSLSHEKSSTGHVRRNSSVPVMKLKELCSQIDSIDKEISLARSAYSTPRYIDESKNKLNQLTAPENPAALRTKLSISEKSANENCACCFEQIEEIKEKAIYSSHYTSVGEETMLGCNFASDNPSDFTQTDSGSANTTSFINTHDVFEVPQYHGVLEHPKLASLKSDLGSKCLKKGILCSQQGSRLNTPRKEFIPDIQHVRSQRTYSVQPLVDVEQIENRLQKLEDRVTINHDFERLVQMKLLREINQQLKSTQSNMNDQKSNKANPQDTSSFISLMEVMLSFSI